MLGHYTTGPRMLIVAVEKVGCQGTRRTTLKAIFHLFPLPFIIYFIAIEFFRVFHGPYLFPDVEVVRFNRYSIAPGGHSLAEATSLV